MGVLLLFLKMSRLKILQFVTKYLIICKEIGKNCNLCIAFLQYLDCTIEIIIIVKG